MNNKTYSSIWAGKHFGWIKPHINEGGNPCTVSSLFGDIKYAHDDVINYFLDGFKKKGKVMSNEFDDIFNNFRNIGKARKKGKSMIYVCPKCSKKIDLNDPEAKQVDDCQPNCKQDCKEILYNVAKWLYVNDHVFDSTEEWKVAFITMLEEELGVED
jgi:hypothetical protein